MQDRFKFRLYDKAIREMAYHVCVGFIKDSGKTDDWVCADTSCGQITYRGDRLKDIVLMQCTGLKDKNGKLIYEGDIISVKIKTQDAFNVEEYYSENYKGEIIFKEGEFAIRVIDTKKQPISLYYYANGCEIIGNIYENPELLEGNN